MAYLKVIALGAAIGIPSALLAWGFLALVYWVQDLLWDDLPSALGESTPPWYLVVGLPVVGALVVVAARRLLPGDGGHAPLGGISTEPTPWQYAPGVALAAVGSLSFGAVLGPEGPLIALGSVVGMVAVSLFKVPEGPARQTLATAGSFSAISALFGGPLVAGMLLLEGGLAAGAALIPALLPGLASAAVGYVLFVGFGDWGGLAKTELEVPDLPVYSGLHAGDLLLAVVVGILASILITGVKALAHRVDIVAVRRPVLLLILGGLAVGLIAQGTELLGGDSQMVLFSGQHSIPELLAEGSVGLLLLAIAGKALGYAVSLGSGFRGGPVFPAIFIGVGIATIACLVFDTSPTWALVVGAAAGMTAGTGLVFASLLFAMLLAGTAGIDAISAATLAVIASWLTTTTLTRHKKIDPADISAGSIESSR